MLTRAISCNRSITLTVLSLLIVGFTHPDTGESLILSQSETMFQPAQLVEVVLVTAARQLPTAGK